ncbi:prenyltransferase/squalene oxidase repeat-containing protein [Streptomyces sp. DH12]|uniref:prenyltransferase/squalene oxidase repeat-containing protein n=1 Tax=Streptomyces sp. DH12 TaxID=2857010 RepID=UPI001E4FA902|nr:prenyltransferase/squalene oxidase repeat-containing protein [Streptomyces sp. DH12]
MTGTAGTRGAQRATRAPGAPGATDVAGLPGAFPDPDAVPGAATGEPDLWCGYAAVRTFAWLGRADAVPDREGTARYLRSRRNADGGYAWSAGMASDAWATFYCTQALADLGHPPDRPERTARWLDSTWTGEAYGMLPGQGAEVWATHFSARTAALLGRVHAPGERDRLLRWLGALQAPDGGLGWTPADARRGRTDVRACFYGVHAWAAVALPGEAPPWHAPSLVAWLRARQDAGGGFRFSPAADVPCAWATYRAVGALAALGAAPRRPAACARWVRALRGASGAFVRWEGYPVEDVWASFSAVGTLRALGAPTGDVAGPVVRRLTALALPGGGFTYREPERADDALSTAALALRPDTPPARRAELVRWLESCQLPNEGGVMYMPGRGAEVRCTLWAVAAGAFAGHPDRRAVLVEWLTGLQNDDGGFGYWSGRGSDLVSTASAVETLRLLDVPAAVLDTGGLAAFTASCAAPGGGYGQVPGAPATLRATLQAHRIVAAATGRRPADPAHALDRHRVRGGGYADSGDRLPDLLSTYEAVVASDRAGLHVDTGHLELFLKAVERPDGTAWTPLSPAGGGALADLLGALLRGYAVDTARAEGPRLPALTLS